MSGFELKTGQGSLFRVAEKTNERGPDYEGKLNVDGTMYRIVGWLKQGKNGKWMSLAVELPREKAALESKPKEQPDFDDDIPL